MALPESEWAAVAKIYGPLGIFCLALVVFVWKGLLPYIKRQHEEHVAALKSTVDDARQERDHMREMRAKEVDKFVESLRLRDEKMERGFDEMIKALREHR